MKICSVLILAALTGCQAIPGGPGGASASGKIDPNTCGNYAASDAGRKLKAFLQATVNLESAVMDSEAALLGICNRLGEPLGVVPTGSLKTDCEAVSTAITEHFQVGFKAGAKVNVVYKPPVCTIDVQAAAEVAARCEGKASADVDVRCDGVCQGTCNGACDGTCEGTAGTGGSSGDCNGQCQGTCQGTCSGSCQGNADIEASASCRAKAEVNASLKAECTEPEWKVEYEAGVVVDTSKVEALVAAIENVMPELSTLQARVTGPLQGAVEVWAASAQELAKSASDLFSSFGEQAACISGQLAAAANAVGRIRASVSVQVSVSASVSGSASGGGGGAAGGGAGGGM